MQKELKSLLIVACIAVSATLVVVACGNGETDDPNEFEADVKTSDDILAGVVADKNSPIWEGYDPTQPPPPPPPPPPPSSDSGVSSGGGGTSSDSGVSSGGGTSSNSGVSSGGGTSSTSPGVSSSSTPKSSAVAVAGNCEKKNQKSGFTCGWDGYTSGAILTPGKVLKPAAATPPSGCSAISWSYAPNTTEIALLYDCEKVPDAGVSALGSKNYVLFAELTCDDGKHVNACNPENGWSSKKAPELIGDCVWLSPGNDKPLLGPPYETSAGKGAKPSGVTLVDNDPGGPVCKDKTIKVKYSGNSKDWTNSPAAGTYTDVQYVASCAEYNVLPVSCPTLKVGATMPDEVICVNKTGDLACTLNDKPVTNSELKFSTASEGCMDLEMDWQNQYHPGSNPALNINLECTYKGTGTAAKTCKLLSNGKELKSVSTNNPDCQLQATSIGKISGVSNQKFPKVCVSVTDGGEIKDTGITCRLGVY